MKSMHLSRPALREAAGEDAAVARPATAKVPTLPFRLRLLLMLTTSAWDADERVHPAVAALAGRIAESGWTIRSAYPRNYLLWRRGRIHTETGLPLLVLPRMFGGLSRLEVNVFLATELFVAQHRVLDGSAPFDTAKLDLFCERLSDSGLAVAERRAVYERAGREISAAVVQL